MNINERSLDTSSITQQNSPDQQYDALSDDFGKGFGIPQAAAIPDEASPTGFPSRILPKERRIQSIAWEKRRGTTLTLMFLDADRFKTINDSLARTRGDDLLQSITQPATHTPHVGVTIGISMHPDDGADAETLILHADIAVYQAENRAGHSYHFFTPGMHGRAIE